MQKILVTNEQMNINHQKYRIEMYTFITRLDGAHNALLKKMSTTRNQLFTKYSFHQS